MCRYDEDNDLIEEDYAKKHGMLWEYWNDPVGEIELDEDED